MTVYLDHLGRTADLTTLLGEGKEGKVSLCAAPGVAVKVLAPGSVVAEKWDQLEQMVAAPMPPGRFAWPLGLARAAAGGPPVGFAMPFVRGASVYEAVFGNTVPGFCGLARIEAAADLADLFDVAHARGVVIGDVSDRNFVVPVDASGAVERPARVVGIDCDGYDVPGRDPTTGRPRRYGEPLGTPPHVPPELLALPTLRGIPRTRAHDRYGLASLLFPMLVGTYAHEVVDTNGRTLPDLVALVRAGQFPHAPATPLPPGLEPKDQTGRWRYFPGEVRQLFVRAFRDGHRDPALRPTAAEWRAALRRWLAAKVARVPAVGPALGPTLVGFLRGRLTRQRLVQALDLTAARLDLTPAWAWLKAGNRLRWGAAGVAAAVLVGASLLRGPAPTGPVADDPARGRAEASTVGDPVRPAGPPRSEAERRAAEARWEGAPPVFREALRERLEGRP